ncbi:hypothetical protein MKW94_015311 [Papaver nudicaule]|uniref:Major facilitator superfamily (MFS) profile domain-containing protein n=1 Tax=Papaver nudicaule TaxID=74823 RepID=A0AA42B1J2_PAPNU|nr:hypothetical protein [Papaver nudicaule]
MFTFSLIQDQDDDAITALKNIYTCCEVDNYKEFDTIRLSIRRETIGEDALTYTGNSIFSKIRSARSIPSVRKQFVVGTGLQVLQQLVGINALIYCMPSIFRIVGFGVSDHKTDIWLMIKSVGSIGETSIISVFCCTLCLLQRFGKRKMLCWGIYSIVGGVLALSFIFMVSPNTTEVVSLSESTIYFNNNTCLSFITAPDADSWDCLTCLRASSGCGFCRGMHNNIWGQSSGACLIAELNGTSQTCIEKDGSWSTQRCEYNVFTFLTLEITALYHVAWSVSLEIIPWIMNSQMYPIEVRGVYGGMAAAANWTFFLVIIVLSFFVNKIGGLLFLFILISLVSFFVLWFIKLFVPEDVGFSISTRKI